MSLSLEQVRRVAHLARLQLTAEEEQRFASQLSAILEAMQSLSEVDTSGVEPTSHASFALEQWREDEVRPSLGAGRAVASAPARSGTSFAVPKIIE